MKPENVNRFVLLLFLVFISALFLSMIRQFLMAVFLAGIFSALVHPFYRRLGKRLGGRFNLASSITLILLIFMVLIPFIVLIGIVTAQAIKVAESVTPWMQKQLAQPSPFSNIADAFPFLNQLEPYKEILFKKAGQIVGSISNFIIDSLSAAAAGTVNFLFTAFILLYTMFFFLTEGEELLNRAVFYLPLENQDRERILARFTSVSRATLKGTAVIGIIQGALGGIAFAVVGIDSAIFWGTLMTILSIIPALGTAIVWAPAAIILAIQGDYGRAVGLTLFCIVVVGLADNFLRPRLVGKDTQMHDLMVIFGTLGGIAMFGIVGLIVGPIIAALFTTAWDIYGVAFQEYLTDRNSSESINSTPPDGV